MGGNGSKVQIKLSDGDIFTPSVPITRTPNRPRVLFRRISRLSDAGICAIGSDNYHSKCTRPTKEASSFRGCDRSLWCPRKLEVYVSNRT